MLRNIFLAIMAFCIGSSNLISDDKPIEMQAVKLENIIPNYEESDMFHARKHYEEVWKDVPVDKRKGWKQFKRWEHFWTQRLFPKGDFKQAMDIYSSAYNQLKLSDQDRLQGNTWKLMGPIVQPAEYNETNPAGLGRINIARFHPTNDKVIWAGAATGGVWYTNDKGKTWDCFPFTQFLSLGVSDIAFSESDPNTVYVATGDADGSLGTSGSYYSIGVIKTTDGGKTWAVTGLSYELANASVITRLQVSKTDPNIVVAATSSGLFKTIDGGKTWEKKTTIGFRDIEAKPKDNNCLYAATSGSRSQTNYIFKSEDFGDTWQQILDIPKAGRIQLAVTPAAPEYLYALNSSTYHDGYHSFMVSKDGGATFAVMSDSATAGNPLNWGYNLSENRRGQSSYDLCLAVSPYDRNHVIIGGIECHLSTDMGESWEKSSNIYGKPNTKMHVDMHDLEYSPLTEELFCSNDGGLYISKDEGSTWIDLSSGMSITQLYKMAISQNDPNLIVCGAQDNGSTMLLNGTWYQLFGGDGMECAIDPTNDNNIWVSIYNGKILSSKDKGKTLTVAVNPAKTDGVEGAWVTPYVLSPTKSGIAYVGFSNIWRTVNGGQSWAKMTNYGKYEQVFTGMSISDKNPDYIYAWKYNTLIRTTNGGTNWETIKVENNTITSVFPHPADPEKFWYTVSGYNPNRKVFYYDGKDFTNLTGNLPNVPVNTIVCQKNTKDKIFIGTDIGVFYTDGGSNQWDNMNDNLPNVIVNDLSIYYGSEIPRLRAGTYGRGVWETDIKNCSNNTLTISPDTNVIKCPHVEVTLTASGNYNNYLWSNGATTKTVTVTEAGDYSVTAMDDGCKIRSKVVNIQNIETPRISVSIADNAAPCIGDTITLAASRGFQTYQWSTGETTREIQVHKSGDYSVIGTRANATCPSYSEIIALNFTEKPKSIDFELQGRRLVADSIAKYQWFKNGNAIPGAVKRVYEIPPSDVEEAMYKVFGANENGCGVFSAEKAAKYTSVSETFTNVYSISPNPSNGEYRFRLFASSGDNIEYVITDAAGRIIQEFNTIINANEFNKTINISSQPDGAYLMKVSLNGKEKIIKLIKK